MRKEFVGTPFDLGALLCRYGIEDASALQECAGPPWADVFLLSERRLTALAQLEFPVPKDGRQAIAVRSDADDLWGVRVMEVEMGAFSGFLGEAWVMKSDGRFLRLPGCA